MTRNRLSNVVTTTHVDGAGLEALLAPRRDVVHEQADDDGSFSAATGPLLHYRRTVDVTPDGDGRYTAVERTSFRLAVPVWGRLFVPLYRRALRRVDGRDQDRRPVWAPPDQMDARESTVLGLLCTAALVAGYLGTVITQTITYAAKQFGSSDSFQANTLAATRVGVIISLVMVARADKLGRRRLLLISAAASCIVTAIGALSPNMLALGISQTVARGLSTTLVLLITIMAAEEMPAGSRTYAVAVMTMTGALGAGMCLWALPLADIGINGWRVVYVIPLLGLPLMLYVGRRLPESRRFDASSAEASQSLPEPAGPADRRRHLRRLLILGTAFFLISAFGAPASQLLNQFLRTERGFSASRISLFTLLTSTPGAIGLVVGGRMADVRGRRLVVTFGVMVGSVLTVFAFASHGAPMWLWSLCGTIVAASAGPALGMYGPELFPTMSRGRSNGIIQVVSVAGSSLGLVIAGYIEDRSGLARAMEVLLVGPLVVGVMVLTLFPETARQELEDLNPEDRPQQV